MEWVAALRQNKSPYDIFCQRSTESLVRVAQIRGVKMGYLPYYCSHDLRCGAKNTAEYDYRIMTPNYPNRARFCHTSLKAVRKTH